MSTEDKIRAIIEAQDWGRPSYTRTGRNRRFRYMAQIKRAGAGEGPRRETLTAHRFQTRTEAIESARVEIEHRRNCLAQRLADPRFTELRRRYGVA